MSGHWRRVLLLGCLLCAWSAAATGKGMHPEVPLLDAEGRPVVESGRPMSTMQTCGGECHDTEYIAHGSDHADAGGSGLAADRPRHAWAPGAGYFGSWDPLRYEAAGLQGTAVDPAAWLRGNGARHVGGGPVAGLTELDCLLCHGAADGLEPRAQWLRDGRFEWANSARFTKTGVLRRVDRQWQWQPGAFGPGGVLAGEGLLVRKPEDANCGQCHGQVDDSLEEPLVISADPGQRHDSERTGQLVSPQKLKNSGLNIADKNGLDRPFDVHSDRVVGCVNCHYSLNNPVFFRQRESSRPAHLEFDPRRLSSAEYLRKPLHQFAKGRATLGLAASDSEHSMRRCESCHQAADVHDWLPFKQRHFNSLACEACHIPTLHGPGLQSIDWLMLDAGGQPLRRFRGLAGEPHAVDTLLHGFRPVMLPRSEPGNGQKLAPFNLVTAWYWTAGDPARPVTREELERALLDAGGHHAGLVAALDRDGDGRLSGPDLVLDEPARVAAVRARLEATGLVSLSLAAEVVPFPVNHNVVSGRWATRDCRTCHGADSSLEASVVLSAYRPAEIVPARPAYPGMSFAGEILLAGDGAVEFLPDSRSAGFYIIGLHGEQWADRIGLLMFLGVVAGVAAHAVARYVASRRRPQAERRYERVYMYDAYERLWHWLQAAAILLLLLTGLIIHKPHFFGILSFPYVVRVHNVLGFILLINAALALFYNLASGEIRQYLPELRGFVGRSMAQALYYSRGIFAGQPHPLEKSRERKLNPLQQITYLVILNVLLPAQVVTGVLIWGLQRWPDIAASLGGFPALALVHTLVAWAFAAFIVMHVYLTTAAGHTPGAAIKSMIEGWDVVERHSATTEDQRTGDPT
jgi:thiosulfate reductase cytochrome b subunit